MRLVVACPQCAMAGNGAAYGLPFSDTDLYRFQCNEGHQVTLGLAAVRFEVLFEIGLQALVDGYYREAVMTFSTSLERFYEFYVRLIWEARGIDPAVRKATWAAVAKQSERQVGLFAATFLIETGLTPPLLPQKPMVELRNDLVHKGKIADEADAAGFGQAVADLIHPALHEAVAKHKDAASALNSEHGRRVLAAAGPNLKGLSWWGSAYPVSRMRAEPNPIDVVAEMQRRRQRAGGR